MTDIKFNNLFYSELYNDDVNSNILIELTAGDKKDSKLFFANTLKLKIKRNYGYLKVTSNKDKPLSKVYVKVYTQMNNGSIHFHKDGYTDLKGNFDYISISAFDENYNPQNINKFSILVLSNENGGIIKEVLPPVN